MYGAYPFMNFHLNRNYKERLYFRVGAGLGYMPVIYNAETNHKNDVIGSHINAMVNFRLNCHFYLSDNVRLETGVGLTHCSNGAYQTPNLGINLITANTGISYCFSGAKRSVEKPFIDTAKTKKIENDIFVSSGLSEIEPPGGKKYLDLTLSYIAFKRLNSKNKLGLGVDVFNNQANIARLHVDGVYPTTLAITQYGVKAAYELRLGNLSLPIEIGSYLYTLYVGNGYLYSRLGLRYYAGKHIITNLTLLTHTAKADFIEWGLGYKL
jgi:Lipid A 3-O-deacylase (PagL)